MNTQSQNFAGPPPSPGANTRHVVSSAWISQESRFRFAIAPASGASSLPACATVPAQRRRGDLRPLPGQPCHQGIHAPARAEALREQHRGEPVREQALPDRLRRARRHHRLLPRAAALSLIAAPAVRDQPDDDLPVQLLPGPVIAQQRERLPAVRAAVPAAREIPEHLEPRQPRIIPPARTRPRTALHLLLLPAARLPAVTGIIIVTVAVRGRAGLLRRPPEHDPLQDRDRGVRLGQLSGLSAGQLPQLLADPGQLRVLLPQLRVLPGQVIDSYRLLLDDFQRPREQLLSGRSAGGQRPGTIRARQNPGPRSHEPQQTLPSPANHAPRPACRSRRPRKTSHPPSQELRRLTRNHPAHGPPGRSEAASPMALEGLSMVPSAQPLHMPSRPEADVAALMLGPLEVDVAGRRVLKWNSLKARAVFQYLLIHRGRPVRRDVLMELQWPDHTHT